MIVIVLICLSRPNVYRRDGTSVSGQSELVCQAPPARPPASYYYYYYYYYYDFYYYYY